MHYLLPDEDSNPPKNEESTVTHQNPSSNTTVTTTSSSSSSNSSSSTSSLPPKTQQQQTKRGFLKFPKAVVDNQKLNEEQQQNQLEQQSSKAPLPNYNSELQIFYDLLSPQDEMPLQQQQQQRGHRGTNHRHQNSSGNTNKKLALISQFDIQRKTEEESLRFLAQASLSDQQNNNNHTINANNTNTQKRKVGGQRRHRPTNNLVEKILLTEDLSSVYELVKPKACDNNDKGNKSASSTSSSSSVVVTFCNVNSYIHQHATQSSSSSSSGPNKPMNSAVMMNNDGNININNNQIQNNYQQQQHPQIPPRRYLGKPGKMYEFCQSAFVSRPSIDVHNQNSENNYSYDDRKLDFNNNDIRSHPFPSKVMNSFYQGMMFTMKRTLLPKTPVGKRQTKDKKRKQKMMKSQNKTSSSSCSPNRKKNRFIDDDTDDDDDDRDQKLKKEEDNSDDDGAKILLQDEQVKVEGEDFDGNEDDVSILEEHNSNREIQKTLNRLRRDPLLSQLYHAVIAVMKNNNEHNFNVKTEDEDSTGALSVDASSFNKFLLLPRFEIISLVPSSISDSLGDGFDDNDEYSIHYPWNVLMAKKRSNSNNSQSGRDEEGKQQDSSSKKQTQKKSKKKSSSIVNKNDDEEQDRSETIPIVDDEDQNDDEEKEESFTPWFADPRARNCRHFFSSEQTQLYGVCASAAAGSQKNGNNNNQQQQFGFSPAKKGQSYHPHQNQQVALMSPMIKNGSGGRNAIRSVNNGNNDDDDDNSQQLLDNTNVIDDPDFQHLIQHQHEIFDQDDERRIRTQRKTDMNALDAVVCVMMRQNNEDEDFSNKSSSKSSTNVVEVRVPLDNLRLALPQLVLDYLLKETMLLPVVEYKNKK